MGRSRIVIKDHDGRGDDENDLCLIVVTQIWNNFVLEC